MSLIASIINCDNRQQGYSLIVFGTGLIQKDKWNSSYVKSKEIYKDPLFYFETPRVTLRESHDEDEVDGDESDEIAHDHPVNHHDKRSDCLEAPAEE